MLIICLSNYVCMRQPSLPVSKYGQLETMDWTLDWTLDWTWTGLKTVFIKRSLCQGQFAVPRPSITPLGGSREFATMCSSQFVRCLCVGGKFVL